MMRPRRPTPWRAGCGTGSGSSYRRPGAHRDDEKIYPSKSLDHSGVDQESIEMPCLGARVASVEHAVAAHHDLFLCVEGRIERDAGGFLDHQRQIGAID